MRAHTKQLLKRLAVGAVIALQLNTVASHAWADSIAASAASGQQAAKGAMEVFDPEAANITLIELFPDLLPGATSNLEDVFGDESQTTTIGSQANARLASEDSMEGEAYRTMIDSNNRVSPDLSNDPMFNTADKVRTPDYMQGFRENFADCKRTDIFQEVNSPAHISKFRTCERVVDRTGEYTFTHDYEVGVIEYVSGQPNFQSCGVGCLYIWVGTVGNNYWEGTCAVFEEFTRFRVINKDAITSAVIEDAAFDDYFEIYFNNDLLWTHTPGVFPPETEGDCERGTSWRVSPGANVTSQIKSDSDVITFKTRTSVTGGGEGYARIKITYDPSKVVRSNGWEPEEDLPVFDQISDGFCPEFEIKCTDDEAVGENGCAIINGIELCPQHMPKTPHKDVGAFCRKVEVKAECAYFTGEMDCYIDAQGTQQCPINLGDNRDSCVQYEEDPSCGFVSQRCIKYTQGESGTCYAYEDVWDCGYDASYKTVVNTGQTVECPGGARCMGTECFDNSNVKSGDFAYAVAMLQVAQFAEHDLDCGGDGTNVEEANDCKVFKGDAMECKKALGGYVDCCEAPENVSIIDYVNLTMNTLKMTSSVEALSRTGSLFSPGYWQAGSSAITSVGSSVITGEWSNIIGNATSAAEKTFMGGVQEGIVSEIQKWLMQQAYDAMVEMGATAAADAVFAVGADGAVSGLGANAAMVVNIIGWVYMVYVIVDLLINIIWECEPKEFELGAKKETRQCTFIGSYCASKALGSCVEKRESYCCYGSVVARIIQESAHSQLGLVYGDVENPSCEGLSPAQLGQMNWSGIDLSEWIGMLNIAGHLPTANTVSLEDVTGSGSRLEISEGDVRLNTLDRNIKRLDGFDADAIKRMEEDIAKRKQKLP